MAPAAQDLTSTISGTSCQVWGRCLCIAVLVVPASFPYILLDFPIASLPFTSRSLSFSPTFSGD